jgi:hypothetical protein
MSISSIPSTFLPGIRDRLTTDLLQLLWERRSSTEKAQVTKEASIGAPPANFLPNPNITSLAREAAWFGLNDAQRATYKDGSAGPSTSGLVTNANSPATYRKTGFGSEATGVPPTTAALDFDTTRLAAISQEPSSTESAAFRAIWKENFASTGLLKADASTGETNGGAIFVSIRAGTGAERVTNPYTDDTASTTDTHDRFKKQVDDQVRGITDRFGVATALLGYDANDNGFLDGERELFGFDGSTAGPSLSTPGLMADRLMVLTPAGASVRVAQSSFATSLNSASGGYLPYTTARTVLQTNTDTGKLEIVVATATGIDVPVAPPKPAWVGIANGTFAVGEDIDLTVTFSGGLVVDPSTGAAATLALDVGGVARTATLQSAAGSTLVFRYTVQPADLDATGVTVPAGAIVAGPGTSFADAAGQAAVLDVPAATNGRTLVRTPPTIAGAAIPDGSYRIGDTVTATLTFDRAVTLATSGSPATLALNVGGQARTATLDPTSGTGTTATFRYTVQAGDPASGSIGVAAIGGGTGLVLNGTTIVGAFGQTATLSQGASTNPAATVDGRRPGVQSVAVANGDFKAGDDVTLTLTFDEPVTLTTGVTLGVTVGGTTRQASVVAASNTTTADFVFTVQPGENAPSGIAIAANALSLGSGTITDASGNPATAASLAISAQTFAGARIDTTAPAVQSITLPPGPSYVTDDAFTLTLSFSEPVDVATGAAAPALQFAIDGTPVFATMVGTGGTGLTTLDFTYTVTAADVGTTIETFAGPGNLSLGDATITDAAGNPLDLSTTAGSATIDVNP